MKYPLKWFGSEYRRRGIEDASGSVVLIAEDIGGLYDPELTLDISEEDAKELLDKVNSHAELTAENKRLRELLEKVIQEVEADELTTGTLEAIGKEINAKSDSKKD